MARSEKSVDLARGFLEIIDVAGPAVGMSRKTIDARIIKEGRTTPTFLKNLRVRHTEPPKGIEADVYKAICRTLNEVSWKLMTKAKAIADDVDQSDVGIEPELVVSVCELVHHLAARAKALIGEDEVARIKEKIAANQQSEKSSRKFLKPADVVEAMARR
jgi:histone H3/H4